jgi:hypothetical protein
MEEVGVHAMDILLINASTQRIRELNDDLRIYGRGGETYRTEKIVALPIKLQEELGGRIRAYIFTRDNDLFQEHDYGFLKFRRRNFVFKIDYLKLESDEPSEDPSDPGKTRRILSLMMADEY